MRSTLTIRQAMGAAPLLSACASNSTEVMNSRAVIMRPVGVDQETTYVPGQNYVVQAGYGSMWGYWGTSWGYAHDPGYVRKDQVVSVEGNVHSDEIVDVTVAEMKRQKVTASR